MKPRKFSLPKSLKGSPPSHAEMGAFIRHEWEDDQWMCLARDIQVTSLKRVDTIIEVSTVFIYNPAEADEYHSMLFAYEDSGFFPTGINRITLGDRYVWEDSLSCDRLDSEKYYCDELGVELSEQLRWDDPTIPEDLFVYCLNMCDTSQIGASLVTRYDASKSMPDFVPARLKPHFERFVAEYLMGEK